MDRIVEIIRADTAHRYDYYGKNIGIAVFDTGIYPHEDFGNRIVGFVDLVGGRMNPYDDNGHGTHVAGIIGGDGKTSLGRYCGIASKCNLIGVKILDYKGTGNTDRVMRAMEWVIANKIKLNIKIINFSMGMGTDACYQDKTNIMDAVEYAWNSGIVVVCAAGNNGPGRGTVTIPGSCRKIITVGSMDDEKNVKGIQVDYSGRGPTENCVRKPEIVAPGTSIISCSNSRFGYTTKSGTSMATPVVSGCLALLLEKYPHLTPAEVKLKLYQKAVKLKLDVNHQGWGMIDVEKLLF
ncbi:MAG: S8 family peptidase [Lachnospiraceae bacterium]